MSWILDLFIIAIIAYYVYISAKRGFVRTLIELVGFVAIFLIITKAGPPLSESIFKTFARGPILSKVETTLTENAASNLEAIKEAMPDFLAEGAAVLGIDIDESLANVNTIPELAAKITDNVIGPAATSLIYAILSLLLFGLGMFLVRIIAKAVNRLFKVSIVGVANRLLGGVLGVGKGVVVAFVFCLIITTIVTFTKNGFLCFTKANIEQSIIFGKLAQWNPFYK